MRDLEINGAPSGEQGIVTVSANTAKGRKDNQTKKIISVGGHVENQRQYIWGGDGASLTAWSESGDGASLDRA